MPPLDWRLEADAAGIRLDRERRRWRPAAATLTRWRQVGWMVLLVVMLHSTALVADHIRLTGQRQQLRQQMEARFRVLFPTAVAVVDPVLQTRRQLTQARHAANQPDDGDFPVMLGKVAAALAGVPAAELQALSYADGRMTLEFSATADKLAGQIETRLVQSGLAVDAPKAAGPAKRGTFTLTLRSS
jgi:general secretion pathway protein L